MRGSDNKASCAAHTYAVATFLRARRCNKRKSTSFIRTVVICTLNVFPTVIITIVPSRVTGTNENGIKLSE